jgi:hypothetical protein
MKRNEILNYCNPWQRKGYFMTAVESKHNPILYARIKALEEKLREAEAHNKTLVDAAVAVRAIIENGRFLSRDQQLATARIDAALKG